MIRKSEHGRISRRYFQIEEDMSLCTPLKVEDPTFYQEKIDLTNYKEWMNAMRDKIDGLHSKNKV